LPRGASEVTGRDVEVLREVARFAAVPPAALAHFFPSRAAAYVRLGVLAERGFLSRTTSFGRRAYRVTPKGAAAAGLHASRAGTSSTARAGRMAAVAALLAPLGYAPVPAPRPSMPTAVAWFSCGKRVVAVYPSSARLTGRQVRRLLSRLRIYRHTAHAIVLLSGGGVPARVVRDWRYPPVIVVPVPIGATGRTFLVGVL
jgi:hypothetical protein